MECSFLPAEAFAADRFDDPECLGVRGASRLLCRSVRVYENEQESGSARAVARALNGVLEASRNPEQTLDAFGKGLGDAEAIRYLPAGTREPVLPLRGKGSSVPAWFVSNLTMGAEPQISSSAAD
jgi:hypothetical protein